MASSGTVLFKNSAIHWRADRIKEIHKFTRGIYILFREEGGHMNVVYVGIASGENAGVRSRIYRHARAKEFTHFSIYEVWDNISETHIKELEGLFLNIYARDEHAFVLNKARSYKPLADTARKTASQWLATTTVETKSEPPRGTKKILD